MAKRFTDSTKWDREWFQDLSLKMKCAWLYLLDRCDHAGIWHVNYKLMSFSIGEKITENELRTTFGPKLKFLKSGKILITQFVNFQYGTLNEGNRAHLSVINLLKKEGAYKDLTRPLQGCKDKDKDKDKCIILNKNKRTKILTLVDALYKEYPKKVGKEKFCKKMETILTKSVNIENTFDTILNAIKKYKNYLQENKTEKKYIKNADTFANNFSEWTEHDAGSGEDYSREDPFAELDKLMGVK